MGKVRFIWDEQVESGWTKLVWVDETWWPRLAGVREEWTELEDKASVMISVFNDESERSLLGGELKALPKTRLP